MVIALPLSILAYVKPLCRCIYMTGALDQGRSFRYYFNRLEHSPDKSISPFCTLIARRVIFAVAYLAKKRHSLKPAFLTYAFLFHRLSLLDDRLVPRHMHCRRLSPILCLWDDQHIPVPSAFAQHYFTGILFSRANHIQKHQTHYCSSTVWNRKPLHTKDDKRRATKHRVTKKLMQF